MHRQWRRGRNRRLGGWRSAALIALFAGLNAWGQPPASFEALARQADAERDSQHSDKAIALYKQALEINPNWVEGLWSYGSLNYDLDRYSDCAAAFHKMTELRPDSAPAWTMAGLSEYKLRHFEAALDALKRVEKLHFDEPAELARLARLHLALVLNKTGGFEKALSVLAELVRTDRKTPDIAVAAGIAGLRKQWLPSETPENQRELVLKLGDAMTTAMEMDPKGAIPKFEEALRAFPSEPNVHFRFGAYLSTQEPERGIAELKQALALEPDHVPALVSLSLICLKRDEVENALDYGRKAVAAAPAEFATHLALGRALLAADQNRQAAEELELAVKLAPASPEAHYSLATAYSRLGRKEDAAREHAEFKNLGK